MAWAPVSLPIRGVSGKMASPFLARAIFRVEARGSLTRPETDCR